MSHQSLTRRGYVLKKKYLTEKDKRQIHRELTFKPLVMPAFQKLAKPQPFSTYLESELRLYLPRYWALEKFDPPKKDHLLDNVEKTDFKVHWDLLPHQEAAWTSIERQFLKDSAQGGGLLSLPCGWGKTFMSIRLASFLGLKTIVVVNKEFLMKQWVKAIQACSNARVGIIQRNKIEIEGNDVVVAMLHSLSQKDYPEEVFEGFGFVIVDECFPYKQNICTDQGPITIGKLYHMWEKNPDQLPLVRSFNEKKKIFEFKKITYAWKKKTQKLIKFTLSKNVVKCTSNHLFLTPSGWKKACEIEIGDLILGTPDKSLAECAVSSAMNEDQYQILLGSFLGDGHIHNLPGGRFRLKIIHGEQQKEYCKWKANMFNVKVEYVEKNGYAQKPAYRFASKILDLEKSLPFNKSSCPQWILDSLDVRGLAIWFMDDGSMTSNTISFSTDSFDIDSVQRIVEMLKRFNIEASCKKYKKEYHCVKLDVHNSIKFVELILPYMHDNCMYKIANNKKFQDYLFDMENVKNNISVFTNRLNIPKKLLIPGYHFKIDQSEYKWDNCIKCDRDVFYRKETSECCKNNKLYSYWKCLPCKGITENYEFNYTFDINYSKYKWDNRFLSYGFMKVNKKEILEYQKDIPVYDLEVEDNHNFIASSGNKAIGIIAHNCHHIASQTFSKSLPKVACKYTLGLSATPIRKDGLTPVFMNFLGPLFHVEKRTGDNRVWVKFLEVTSFTHHFDLEVNEMMGSKDTGKMITNIAEYETMNYLILELVRILVAQQPRQILILGARREQLEWLNGKCQELSFKNFKKKYATSGLYYGNQGVNKKLYWEMMEKSAQCDIIWGTNEIAKEGLDIPTLNTLILLSGGHDVEQAVGRILRKHHDDAPPLVIDMVYKCGNFPKHAKSRQDYYNYEDYIMQKEQVEIGLNPDKVTELAPKLEEFLGSFPEPNDPGVLKVKKKKNPNLELEEMVNQSVPSAARSSLAGRPKKKGKANDPVPLVKKTDEEDEDNLSDLPKISWPRGCLLTDDDDEVPSISRKEKNTSDPDLDGSSEGAPPLAAVTPPGKSIVGPPACTVSSPSKKAEVSGSSVSQVTLPGKKTYNLSGLSKVAPVAPPKGRRRF